MRDVSARAVKGQRPFRASGSTYKQEWIDTIVCRRFEADFELA